MIGGGPHDYSHDSDQHQRHPHTEELSRDPCHTQVSQTPPVGAYVPPASGSRSAHTRGYRAPVYPSVA